MFLSTLKLGFNDGQKSAYAQSVTNPDNLARPIKDPAATNNATFRVTLAATKWKKLTERYVPPSDTTTCIKAGLSTVGHLNNLVTKNVTKYAVLTTFKILKIKKNISNFLKKIFVASSSNFFFKLEIFYNFESC